MLKDNWLLKLWMNLAFCFRTITRNLQVVVESSLHHPSQLMPTGTCILVEGILKRESVPGKHVVRLEVEKILHVGKVEQEKYPLSKKRMPMDILRKFSYFRPRTTTVECTTFNIYYIHFLVFCSVCMPIIQPPISLKIVLKQLHHVNYKIGLHSYFKA